LNRIDKFGDDLLNETSLVVFQYAPVSIPACVAGCADWALAGDRWMWIDENVAARTVAASSFQMPWRGQVGSQFAGNQVESHDERRLRAQVSPDSSEAVRLARRSATSRPRAE